MTAIADLLDPRAAQLLAAARLEAVQRERDAGEAAASTPVSATCPACGQLRQVPAVVFRDAP
jgi:hypothetical protein